MVDHDLAKLYQVETKRINEAVKNNADKFPERYAFRITENDYINLKSKFSTSSYNNYGGSRKGHTVFTEQGIYMLATVLKSKTATQVTLNIMDTFVLMKQYISKNLMEQRYINHLVLEDHDKIKALEMSFDKSQENTKINTIFFNGQIYDAYSLLLDILNISKKEIIIIDNYASKELLDILKNINKKIIILTSNIDSTLKMKYESQYNNITFISNNTFHDRFIIIDKSKLYSCGASFKDLGKKCFAINEMESKELLNNLLDRIIN